MAFDPAKAKLTRSYNYPGTFYGLAHDSHHLFGGGDDSAVHVFDLRADKKQAIAKWSKHQNYVSALLAVRRGNTPVVVSGSYDRHLIWWDANGGQPLRTVEAHAGWVRDLAATPDGGRLVSVGDDMRVKVWDADSGRLVRDLEGHAPLTPQGHVSALYAVAVSPDGRFLASGDRVGDVRIWETDTGKLAQRFEVPVLYTYDPRQRKRSIGGIRALAFSPDGRHLAAGGIGQVGNVDGLGGPAHVEVWDWQAPRRRFAAGAQGHKALINSLRYHPAGWLIAGGGGSDGGLIAFWKTDTAADGKEPVVTRHKTDGHVHRIALNAAGTELYAAGFRKLEIWSLPT